MKIKIEIPDRWFCHDELEGYSCPCLDTVQVRCQLYKFDLMEIRSDTKEGLSNTQVYKCNRCFNNKVRGG